MIYYKTEEEIEIIKEGAEILGKTHGEIAKLIKPGVKTSELDKVAFEFIADHGAKPSFKGYNGFPYTLCISTNDKVVHGMPGDEELKEGDIISVDCGVFYKGFHSDSAYTYPVGTVSEEVRDLLIATKQSLYEGIEQAFAGNRIGDIGHAVQKFVEARGYSVVRELVGHGLGKNLHEGPEVPNYGKPGKGIKLQEGLVIAIEPMINLGKKNIIQ
ncbi:MAG TPA: type I methionyl aminopeptidase, partial [Cytophagaceae bacterium]